MRPLQSTICAAILVLGAWGRAADKEKEPEPPKASDGWPMILLSEPFHIGDAVMNDMEHPKPMGRDLKRTFVLDEGARSLYVAVWLTSTVGPEYRDFRAGHYQIRLMINGKEVNVLNKRLPRRRKPRDQQKVLTRVAASDVKAGTNELVIRGGAKGREISECEVHKIILSLTRP